MNNNAIEHFISAVKEPEYETNTTYSAIVSRVDSEGVAWVNLAGSEKETPTASTSADVKAGDVVTVQWRNNKLYIAGNYSDPSAGVIRVANVEAAANTAREAANNAVVDAGRARDAAEQAEVTAESVHGIAVQAQADAEAAQNSLKSVVQGATTVEKAVSVMQTALEAVAEYDPNAITETFTGDGTETDFTLQTKATNILSVTVDGESAEYTTAVENGVTIVTISPAPDNESSVSVSYDTTKEWFWHDANGAHVLGDDNGYRNDITSTGMKIMDVTNEESVAEFGAGGSQIGKTLGPHTVIDEDGMQIYSYEYSTVTPLANIGYGPGKDSSGQLRDAPYFSLGTRDTDAIGNMSVAENEGTEASGYASHAEGEFTRAIGNGSHAEGVASIARGNYSHAEGQETLAQASYSHAQNLGTIAFYQSSTAIGKYNESDNVPFMVGNGTNSSNRSNALTVDWSGNVCLALDTAAASGTDHDLYAAITALGWQSDVIV